MLASHLIEPQRTRSSRGRLEMDVPDRKQFRNVEPADADLVALLEKTKDVQVTDEQLREQRISFAFGNAPHSSRVTRDKVVRASGSLRL